ncbi:GH3 auxin-responsive promoter [Boletus edulis BED1]|uniref:GH3 auxin-responsive promoter n=1 Tax=Boletus edulis BED1 TaxID=1328754 RepID=A0AAD4BI15_BOLED|nr:GH3 auxin-responsive promoter [Boletus edulis BED1]
MEVLTPELRSSLTKRTDLYLLDIITANLPTQYASQAPSLAPFRDVVSVHGTAVVATLLNDFRSYVPVTDYEVYKPWIARFHEIPCKESRVNNLFAPGLPFYIGMSSSTSGKEPKLVPWYQHTSFGYQPPRPIFDFSDIQGPTPCIIYYGYREIKQVEREPGHVVKRIPLCLASAGQFRMKFGWNVEDDEGRLSTIMPAQVAPWGTSMITHNRSFLLIHGLFCLIRPDIDQFFVTFATIFVDLVRCVDEEWDMLVTCIRNGKIPDLDGIGRLRAHIQAVFSADPARADELYEIGPPSSGDGWAARVWPRLRTVAGICSGSFGTCLPKLRSILGPTIAIRNHGYSSSEAHMSVFFDPNDTETFVFSSEEVIEFVAAESEAICANILQGWELEVGKRYQIVLTTRNGLWRYLLDDIIEIIGFDPQNGSPVFKYMGRKTLVIRLSHVVISDAELLAAIRSISSEEFIQVLDFTTVLDKRKTPQTIGFFIELARPLGLNAHMTAQRLFEALGTANNEYRDPPQSGETCMPTIRIVKPGTFMEYRRWKGEKMRIGLGQIKVPVVLANAEAQEWMLERVTQEL